MSEPAWKKLVEQLRSRGHESAYLERLRDRLPAASAGDNLARELLQEMAGALGRAEDKINVSLLRLELLALEIDELDGSPDRGPGVRARVNRKIDAFNQEREIAAKSVWELRVHREALGFRRNQELAELYPIPKRREPR
jgi:hypothetical protein